MAERNKLTNKAIGRIISYTLCLFGFLFIANNMHAVEPIPRDEFIKITDEALDSLEAAQSVLFNNPSTTEAKNVTAAAEEKVSRYYRYVPLNDWVKVKGEQRDIFVNILSSSHDYSLYANWVEADINYLRAANNAKNEAIELFQKYRTNHRAK